MTIIVFRFEMKPDLFQFVDDSYYSLPDFNVHFRTSQRVPYKIL